MTADERLDAIRKSTLDRIDRSDRWFKALIAVAFLTEIAGLTTFLLLMDFGDRTHWLILLAAVLVYMTIAWWTWGLAAHANRSSLRILQSLDLVHAELQDAATRNQRDAT